MPCFGESQTFEAEGRDPAAAATSAIGRHQAADC